MTQNRTRVRLRQAGLPTQIRGEPVVIDTGTRRVVGRGIYFLVAPDRTAVYLRLGPLGWIRFDHWIQAMWAARALAKAVSRLSPYGNYKPITEQLRALADQMARSVAVGANGPTGPDVARWVERLQQLTRAVERLEEQAL